MWNCITKNSFINSIMSESIENDSDHFNILIIYRYYLLNILYIVASYINSKDIPATQQNISIRHLVPIKSI